MHDGSLRIAQRSRETTKYRNSRLAFTIGDNTTNVVETGLYNLTKDEAPALIHFGQDRTEQWLLVRLQQGQQQNQPSQ